jgi:hypothetical protein
LNIISLESLKYYDNRFNNKNQNGFSIQTFQDIVKIMSQSIAEVNDQIFSNLKNRFKAK